MKRSRDRSRRPIDDEPLEGHVRDLAFGGDGVVVTERGVVFVPGALPGERVQLLAQSMGRPPRGRLVRVIEPSADRVEPECPIVDRCGGCPLMRLSIAAQRRVKAAWIAAALADHGAPPIDEVVASAELGYRRRARMRWRRNPPAIGFDVARSQKLLDVERCVVLDPALSLGLDVIRAELLPRLAGEGELALGIGRDGLAVARLSSDTAQRPAVYDAARGLLESRRLAGIVLEFAGAPGALGEPAEHALGLDGVPLVGPPIGGFSQANREVNEAMVSRVVELAEVADKNVLELHAGHGNITIALAPGARSLVSIESDRDASAAARDNVRARGHAHVRVIEATAAEHLGRVRRGDHDVIVVDPPRSGLDAATTARIAELRVARIVYTSCNPPALQRDVASLAAHGYTADRAVVLEMFPQTSHVEAVVRLVR